jgi:hypothetical protein
MARLLALRQGLGTQGVPGYRILKELFVFINRETIFPVKFVCIFLEENNFIPYPISLVPKVACKHVEPHHSVYEVCLHTIKLTNSVELSTTREATRCAATR